MSRDCKILIVDDEETLCFMLRESLEDDCTFIDVSFSATDAIEKIKLNSYDIIVTDLRLGDGTGTDILKLAKEKDQFCEVLIITGYGTLESASMAINMGVSAYLNKPVSLAELKKQVNKAMAKRNFHLKSITYADESVKYGDPNKIRKHLLNLSALYNFSSKLMIQLSVTELMQIILNELNMKFNLSGSMIGISYRSYKELFFHGSSEFNPSRDFIKKHLSENIDNDLKIFTEDDIKNNYISINILTTNKETAPLHKLEINTFPLSLLGENLGFLTLFLHKKITDEEELEFMSVLSSLISAAVQHGYLDDIDKEHAKTDGLTGIFNHRMFHEVLSREIARTKRNGNEFSLVIIDVDDFKKVNDKYGHLVGDAILIDLTQQISFLIRESDFFARYGGEEFALILADTNIDGAVTLVNRIIEKINNSPYQFATKCINYTVSMGVASFGANNINSSKNQLIEKADKALYTAKTTGKNRAVVG